MFRSRQKREVKPLSLSVLLSFNELAWIAVGAIALVFVFFWREYVKLDDRTLVRVPEVAYQELTNRPVLGTTGMVVSVESKMIQPGERAILQTEYQQLIQRPSLKAGEAVVNTNHGLPVLLPGERAITEAEWAEWHDTNFVRITRVNYEDLAARPPSPKPGTTNVPAAKWRQLLGEGQFRKELINLKGGLTNVVILLDASASMTEKGRLQKPRWEEAQSVIEAWLKYLPIQRCALVIFSDVSKPYTTGPQGRPDFWEMSDASRTNLVQFIRRREPEGNTGTWSALVSTYNDFPKADTIILFTDGKPYVPRSNTGNTRDGIGTSDAASISREEMKRVLALVSGHTNVPINVVALGDYFEKEQANFLLELCRTTGGSFLGR